MRGARKDRPHGEWAHQRGGTLEVLGGLSERFTEAGVVIVITTFGVWRTLTRAGAISGSGRLHRDVPDFLPAAGERRRLRTLGTGSEEIGR